MEFSAGIHCLASVGEGEHSIRLWDVDSTGLHRHRLIGSSAEPSRCRAGTLKPRFTEDFRPEYDVPRFVAFANNDTELLVGYFEQAVMRRYSVDPWQLLERKFLSETDELEVASEIARSRQRCFLANTLYLPRTNQLVVFNWQNGLDIYNFPDLVCKHIARYEIASRTSQGVASFRSGKLLASPTIAGQIIILNTSDASVLTTLQIPRSRHPFQAIDALTVPIRNAEYVVGASIGKGTETFIAVWRKNVQSQGTQPATQAASHPSSLFWQLAIALLVYLLCTFIPPFFLNVIPDGFEWKIALPWM